MNKGMTHIREIFRKILEKKPGQEIVIPKELLPRPCEYGFEPIPPLLGDPKGAKRQYRLYLRDGRSLHLREYDTHYTLHWDKRDPRTDPLGHLIEDARGTLLFILSCLFFTALIVFRSSNSFNS